MKKPRNLIVVGDRVLVTPGEGEERTNVGLYLPPTAIDRQAVQGGRIVATGPGTPLPDPTSLDDEPWKIEAESRNGARFVPMQARIGDYALFFRARNASHRWLDPALAHRTRPHGAGSCKSV